MQHPLAVTPSLAPYGFVFPSSKERLEYKPPHDGPWVNTEALISRMWEEMNDMVAPRPLPLVTILHELLPGQATANRLDEGDFSVDGLPFLSRDIALISTLVQWFGTSVGNAFIESGIPRGAKWRHDHEFVLKFNNLEKQDNLIAHLMHTCTPHCESTVLLMYGRTGHDYSLTEVTKRDRAVASGLMMWLGKPAGREFIAQYLERKKLAWEEARKSITDAVAKVLKK